MSTDTTRHRFRHPRRAPTQCRSSAPPVWPASWAWLTRNVIEVNSYHHQAVRPDQLGDGLAVSATAEDGAQVEAIEAADPDTWVFGVQNHPERPEFTPPEFARLWQAFVAAAAERRGG